MINHELDLEQIIEMEHFEQPEDLSLVHTGQYGLDIKDPAYLEQGLWGVEQAINEIREQPQVKKPCIAPVEDDFEIFEVYDDSPEIVRYLKEP